MVIEGLFQGMNEIHKHRCHRACSPACVDRHILSSLLALAWTAAIICEEAQRGPRKGIRGPENKAEQTQAGEGVVSILQKGVAEVACVEACSAGHRPER